LKGLLLLIALGMACPAAADIYKCVDAQGRTSYNDSGCPAGTRQVEVRREINPAAPPPETAPPLAQKLTEIWREQHFDLGRYHLLAGAVYLVMSLLCYWVYDIDQQRAVLRQRRIPESVLHLIELLGGWPGGFIAQRVLHHKSRKVTYQLVFWCIAGLHAAAWTDLLGFNGKWTKALLEAVANW
jgi:uncharacterized membrane protein YsdA (DUF1294 family)